MKTKSQGKGLFLILVFGLDIVLALMFLGLVIVMIPGDLQATFIALIIIASILMPVIILLAEHGIEKRKKMLLKSIEDGSKIKHDTKSYFIVFLLYLVLVAPLSTYFITLVVKSKSIIWFFTWPIFPAILIPIFGYFAGKKIKPYLDKKFVEKEE